MDNYQKLILIRLSFLVDKYNFSEPKIYNIAYENHIEYKKDNFSINIATEVFTLLPFNINTYKKTNSEQTSEYFVITELIPLEEYTKRLNQIEEIELPKEIISEENIVHNQNYKIDKLINFDKELRLNIELLLENEEILFGDLTKFSATYKLKEKIKQSIKSIF